MGTSSTDLEGAAIAGRSSGPAPADPTMPIETVVRSGPPSRGAAPRRMPDVPRVPERPRPVDGARLSPWDGVAARLIPVGLYALGVALLLVRIGSHPASTYNWESYTAWSAFQYWDGLTGWGELLRLTDGLMTDSGKGPLVVLPIWVGWSTLGVGIEGLRVPIAVIAALAVPLTWLVGRRLVGPGAALIGATLLALSPVFLIYGRSATLVGISLVPALATIYALLRVVRPDQAGPGGRRSGWLRWLGWLAALQVLLVANSYAYAVIRFLWPIAVLLLLGEFVQRRGLRLRFAAAFAVTLVALPLALLALGARDGFPSGPGEVESTLRRYFNGRGEQIVALQDNPGGYGSYLQGGEAVDSAADSTDDLARRLIAQNAWDYVDLHLDRGTRPAITDHWNAHGRLLSQSQVPFFLLGAVLLLALAWRPAAGVEARAALALYLGLGLPLLLTSRVHIGRLIFTVPLLCLFIGAGIAGLVAIRRDRQNGSADDARRAVFPAVALALIVVGVTAADTWADYTVAPTPEPARGWALAMMDRADDAQAAGGAVLVLPSGLGDEIEGVNVASIRVIAGETYRFINLRADAPRDHVDADLPALYYGNVIGLLADSPSRVPDRCDAVYFVRADAQEEFDRATNNGRPNGCARAVTTVVLE